MHWILTIFLVVYGKPVLDHQEYFGIADCQRAATTLKQQYKQTWGMDVTPLFACTPNSDWRN